MPPADPMGRSGRVIPGRPRSVLACYLALHAVVVIPLMTLLSVGAAVLVGDHARLIELRPTGHWPGWLLVPLTPRRRADDLGRPGPLREVSRPRRRPGPHRPGRPAGPGRAGRLRPACPAADGRAAHRAVPRPDLIRPRARHPPVTHWSRYSRPLITQSRVGSETGMTAMRMGWGASARGALVLLGAALLGAAGWAGQAAAATATAGTHAVKVVSAAPS